MRLCVCVNDANPLCGASDKYPEDETHLLLGNSRVFSRPTITFFVLSRNQLVNLTKALLLVTAYQTVA